MLAEPAVQDVAATCWEMQSQSYRTWLHLLSTAAYRLAAVVVLLDLSSFGLPMLAFVWLLVVSHAPNLMAACVVAGVQVSFSHRTVHCEHGLSTRANTALQLQALRSHFPTLLPMRGLAGVQV